MLDKKTRIILFGASELGQMMLESFSSNKQVICFIDNDSKKHNTEFAGLSVKSPDDIRLLDYDYIVISSSFYDEILEQLLSMGIPEEKIASVINGELVDISIQKSNATKTIANHDCSQLQRDIKDMDKNPCLLLICPMQPSLNQELKDNQMRLLKAGKDYCEENGLHTEIMIVDWAPTWGRVVNNHPQRVRHIAAIRNHSILKVAKMMVERQSLATLSHVIWMDADIVEYDVDLFYRLVHASLMHNAITAPMIFLKRSVRRNINAMANDHSSDHAAQLRLGLRWYDTTGFINNGERASINWPWFNGAPTDRKLPLVYELDGSVGCIYCVPWSVYSDGASYHYVNENVTEHFSVCQFAKNMGYRLMVLTDVDSYHAFLPDYGEKFH